MKKIISLITILLLLSVCVISVNPDYEEAEDVCERYDALPIFHGYTEDLQHVVLCKSQDAIIEVLT